MITILPCPTNPIRSVLCPSEKKHSRDSCVAHDGQVALQLMGRVTIQHSLQLMRCHRCHICCSRSVLANLGCVCRPSWWIWLWPEAKAGPVWAKSGSKCIISLVFVNLVFRPRLYPTFELSGPYQHIWMISHDFRLSQLQHPRNRQQHARLCHNRGNRRRQVYKGTLIISIFYNYYHLMKTCLGRRATQGSVSCWRRDGPFSTVGIKSA